MIFGVLYLVALTATAVVFIRMRSNDAPGLPFDDDDDADDGGNDRSADGPKSSPGGGIPLTYATQSRVRLRDAADRLADPSRRRLQRREPAPAHGRPRMPARF